MAKILISLPEELLARVDREADARGVSRSRFLQEAAQRELGWATPAVIDAALARARVAMTSAGTFDSTDLIRGDRDGREQRDRRRL